MTTAPSTLERAQSNHERLADIVLANAHDTADARQLFEMLGLVEPGGHELLPDDNRPIPMGDMGKATTKVDPLSSPRAQAESGRRPENCTTPPGLRDLPPLPAEAKRKPRPAGAKTSTKKRSRTVATEKRRRRAVAECGTRSGYARHLRLQEPTCARCRAANGGRPVDPPEVTETARLIAVGVNAVTAAVLGERAAAAIPSAGAREAS